MAPLSDVTVIERVIIVNRRMARARQKKLGGSTLAQGYIRVCDWIRQDGVEQTTRNAFARTRCAGIIAPAEAL